MSRLKILLITAALGISVALYFKFSAKPADRPSTKADYRELYQKAQKGDLKAKKWALYHAKDKTPLKREQAAGILGLFDDPKSTEALTTLLTDPVEMVITKTIYALANTKSIERENILIDQMQNQELSDRHKTHLFSALIRLSDDPAVKESCVENLLYLLKNSTDQVSRQLSSSTLSQSTNQNPKIIESFKKYLNDENSIVASNIIRYFAATKNSWFKAQVLGLAKKPKLPEDNTIAIIETLHLTCAEERFSIISNFLNSENTRIRKAAIRQLGYHDKDKSIQVLNHFLGGGKATEAEKSLIAKTTQRLNAPHRHDRCL